MADFISIIKSRWELLDDKTNSAQLSSLQKLTVSSYKKQLLFIVENALVVNSTIYITLNFFLFSKLSDSNPLRVRKKSSLSKELPSIP